MSRRLALYAAVVGCTVSVLTAQQPPPTQPGMPMPGTSAPAPGQPPRMPPRMPTMTARTIVMINAGSTMVRPRAVRVTCCRKVKPMARGVVRIVRGEWKGESASDYEEGKLSLNLYF